jgi:hypothetical protein
MKVEYFIDEKNLYTLKFKLRCGIKFIYVINCQLNENDFLITPSWPNKILSNEVFTCEYGIIRNESSKLFSKDILLRGWINAQVIFEGNYLQVSKWM